jgi:putative hydrolase of the HAD superfamily
VPGVVRRPALVLLDLDDTILDDTGAAERCWRDAISGVLGTHDAATRDHVYTLITTTRRWYWQDPQRHAAGRADMLAARRGICRAALSDAGYPTIVSDAIADAHHALRDERITLLPGALGSLETLAAAGIPLGLVTNGAAAAQRAKVTRFRLEQYFSYVGIEGEAGVGKPDREAYHRPLRTAGVVADDAWMCGDNYYYDVLGAQRAGLRGVWINRDGTPPPASDPPPFRVVTAFRDVPALLGL